MIVNETVQDSIKEYFVYGSECKFDSIPYEAIMFFTNSGLYLNNKWIKDTIKFDYFQSDQYEITYYDCGPVVPEVTLNLTKGFNYRKSYPYQGDSLTVLKLNSMEFYPSSNLIFISPEAGFLFLVSDDSNLIAPRDLFDKDFEKTKKGYLIRQVLKDSSILPRKGFFRDPNDTLVWE